MAILFEILQRSTIGDVFMLMAPLWIAILVGVFVGWAWKPKWANLIANSFDSAFLGLPIMTSQRGFHLYHQSSQISTAPAAAEKEKSAVVVVVVAKDDLEHLCRLVEEKDGGPSWIQMMDRSTPSLSYQAWRRDPENGPPQYRSRTVFEDATPEMVRDLFWDDDFRLKWDDMLIHAETLEECPNTGTMVVRWVRKFPFFCSDREYIIGRRIWESGRAYYCVTKGVPCPSDLQRNKPRRVDLYYSSWYIRAVESKRGDGQLTACEVLLFHHEEMGIPWEIAKLGVRQGMWGAVKKIDPGLRVYQRERESGASLSRCAFMAQINTKVSADFLRSLESTSGSSEVETPNSSEKPSRRNMRKFLFVGGAIVLACSLDRGLLTKAVIFGVARSYEYLDANPTRIVPCRAVSEDNSFMFATSLTMSGIELPGQLAGVQGAAPLGKSGVAPRQYSTHGLRSIHQRIVCLFYTKESVLLRWILGNSGLKLWWILEWLIVVIQHQRCRFNVGQDSSKVKTVLEEAYRSRFNSGMDSLGN
ncbi:hypothetical protein TEA_008951 [Camellia sinensis var. sinensis]|uniref:START domain-containing protein n=1 Tax=Camellia sinensis var. sinensis TaxID=542762 RepID=A0A4S4EJ27_CAMSN|nr:hypothetical protein TEA_008951 [Camellia sinensis var. sinensis]